MSTEEKRAQIIVKVALPARARAFGAAAVCGPPQRRTYASLWARIRIRGFLGVIRPSTFSLSHATIIVMEKLILE